MTAMPSGSRSPTRSAPWRRRSSAWPSTCVTAAAWAVRHGRPRLRGALRLAHGHRQPHGLRQAPGAHPRRAASPSAARTSSTSALFAGAVGLFVWLVVDPQRRPSSTPCWGSASRSACSLVLPIGGADMPVGDLAAQLLRRPGRRGDGFAHRQQRADHRRRARRRLGLHPLDHHEQGHEPLVRQRAVRRPSAQVAAAAARPARGAAGASATRRRTPRSMLENAQLGDHRPRLRHGRRPGAARGPRAGRAARAATASTSATPSTRSPAACPAT